MFIDRISFEYEFINITSESLIYCKETQLEKTICASVVIQNMSQVISLQF